MWYLYGGNITRLISALLSTGKHRSSSSVKEVLRRVDCHALQVDADYGYRPETEWLEDNVICSDRRSIMLGTDETLPTGSVRLPDLAMHACQFIRCAESWGELRDGNMSTLQST